MSRRMRGWARFALVALALTAAVLLRTSAEKSEERVAGAGAAPAPLFLMAHEGFGPSTLPANPHGPISISCESCHSAGAWIPLRADLRFDHDSQTRFPLTGRHAVASCRSCHFDLVFTEPRLFGDGCQTCHVDVHLGQLGPDCSSCHGTVDFALARAEFVHARTAFPLTGAHRQISCASCHGDSPDGRFAPVDAACVTCHEADYIRARPDHVEAGFPTTCERCHGTLTWHGARFDHDPFFPIFTGSHAGAWSSCQSCHLQPGSFETFSCTHCHEHRRDRMDDRHDDVTGYVYESRACLACHPTGEDL